jgi:uncharacterized phage-associated protein
MAYRATDVAKHIISVAYDCGDEITPLKLQKILYYIQGAYLALKDRPVFDDEILAWKLGPVVYSVYSEFKKYEDNAIPLQPKTVLSDADDIFISEVYMKYRKFTSGQLVKKTHGEAPWKDSPKSGVISRDALKNHFSAVYAEEKLLANTPVLTVLPKEMYDPKEDAIWEAYL